jgi:3-oxoacyl-[acyl-carrier-protein] synthase II
LKPVAITGAGVLSPLGLDRHSQLRELEAGRSALREPADPRLLSMGVCGTGRVSLSTPPGSGRAGGLAVQVARRALADAGLGKSVLPDGAAVSISTSKGPVELLESALGAAGPGESPAPLQCLSPDAATREVAAESGCRGTAACRVAACASGALAVLTAASDVAAGRCPLVIAGAAEASLTPFIHAGFLAMGALAPAGDAAPYEAVRPFDTRRKGFLLAEGAAAFVLEDPAAAASRGARVRARLLGWAEAAEACDTVRPDPGGEGELRAARLALERAGRSPAEIGAAWLHGTATLAGDPAELRALERLAASGDCRLAATASKGHTGHMLGASGAVELGFAVMCLEAGLVPPVANLGNRLGGSGAVLLDTSARPLAAGGWLVLSSGFGGHAAALVVERGG